MSTAVATDRALSRAATIVWCCVIVALAACFGCYLRFALQAIALPFGLDYTEGEI